MKKFLLVAQIFAMVVLVGCGDRPRLITHTEVVETKPPKSLFVVPSDPKKPTGDYGEKAVGVYILKLKKSSSSCHSSLGLVYDYIWGEPLIPGPPL